jgi:hypothetical protein
MCDFTLDARVERDKTDTEDLPVWPYREGPQDLAEIIVRRIGGNLGPNLISFLIEIAYVQGKLTLDEVRLLWALARRAGIPEKIAISDRMEAADVA